MKENTEEKKDHEAEKDVRVAEIADQEVEIEDPVAGTESVDLTVEKKIIEEMT